MPTDSLHRPSRGASSTRGFSSPTPSLVERFALNSYVQVIPLPCAEACLVPTTSLQPLLSSPVWYTPRTPYHVEYEEVPDHFLVPPTADALPFHPTFLRPPLVPAPIHLLRHAFFPSVTSMSPSSFAPFFVWLPPCSRLPLNSIAMTIPSTSSRCPPLVLLHCLLASPPASSFSLQCPASDSEGSCQPARPAA